MIVHVYQATISSTSRCWDHLESELTNAWAVNVAVSAGCLAEMSQEKPGAKISRVIQRQRPV